MELRSLDELRKWRRKLAKIVDAPIRYCDNPRERELIELGNQSIRKEIADIDAEIQERTAGQSPER